MAQSAYGGTQVANAHVTTSGTFTITRPDQDDMAYPPNSDNRSRAEQLAQPDVETPFSLQPASPNSRARNIRGRFTPQRTPTERRHDERGLRGRFRWILGPSIYPARPQLDVISLLVSDAAPVNSPLPHHGPSIGPHTEGHLPELVHIRYAERTWVPRRRRRPWVRMGCIMNPGWSSSSSESGDDDSGRLPPALEQIERSSDSMNVPSSPESDNSSVFDYHHTHPGSISSQAAFTDAHEGTADGTAPQMPPIRQSVIFVQERAGGQQPGTNLSGHINWSFIYDDAFPHNGVSPCSCSCGCGYSVHVFCQTEERLRVISGLRCRQCWDNCNF